MALLGFTVNGAHFIFGDLVFDTVPVGTGVVGQGAFTELPGQVARTGASFAFNVLPTIIFFSALMTVLYHLGIMQVAVKGVAWVMQRTMRTSGAESLSAAGNIFVGQTEAPLLIKPFIDKMTMSELMAVMTGGFATVAGGVLAAYVGILLAYFPDIAGHLMAASVMSAPAALVVAKLMYPEDSEPETAGTLEVTVDKPDVNVIDAAARGASEGLFLALNVGAMLLAFIALTYMLNGLLGWAGGLVGWEGLTFELLLGWALAPLAWLMGVPWSDAPTVASLMGVKTVLNEFVAYFQLASTLSGEHGLEPRSIIIVTYALSGFANFSSIAIQIGGIGGIAPSRRQDVLSYRTSRDGGWVDRGVHDGDRRGDDPLSEQNVSRRPLDVRAAADHLRAAFPSVPRVAVVLGSGLGPPGRAPRRSSLDPLRRRAGPTPVDGPGACGTVRSRKAR